MLTSPDFKELWSLFEKSRSDLIRAKEVSGRTQNKIDAQMLKEAEKLSW